ncbi:hypothetical protein TH53_09730 [Pedobacter lusitanus]|uniref:Uncharacterized protein n=1 Tax=Pedobacter lusitanus TaxID=1503925 RepID=A0A0D0GJH5_9SPHI|nr:hypothetical protein [Pedobacter lusitanus]KIO77377.1 hypothetical protein TH53_09730 [Pedobacter lusitanus]
MYPSGEALIILLLAIGAAGILLLGLLLSIVVFFKKKTAIEIIAWICSGLSLALYLTFLHFGLSSEFRWSDLFLLIVILTFFLLLQYRSAFAQGAKLKIVLIFRTVLILMTFATVCKAIINLLITANLIDPSKGGMVQTFYTLQSVIFWCIMTASGIWYLYKINPPLVKSEIFKTAVFFSWPVFFLVVTLGMLLFYMEYTNMNRGITISMLFNRKFLISQLGFLIFGCAISAIIATSIYYYFKTTKDKNITTV